MREQEGLKPKPDNREGSFSPLGKGVQHLQPESSLPAQPEVVLIVLPEDVPAKVLRLAKTKKEFLPELSESEAKYLQTVRQCYDKREDHVSLASNYLYFKSKDTGGEADSVLRLYLHAPDVVRALCNKDDLSYCWEALSWTYEEGVLEEAPNESSRQVEIPPFDKFISNFLVDTFYKQVAERGLCDNSTLLLLGMAKLRNPKLDTEAIYRNAHNSKYWQTKNKEITIEYCKLASNALARVDRSEFKGDAVRIFVNEQSNTERSLPVSEEATRESYLKVATYYGAAKGKRVDEESFSHLCHAGLLNPNLNLPENCIEGLRHFFLQIKRDILAECNNLRAMPKMFEDFGKKALSQQLELRELTNREILQIQKFTQQLQKSYGAIGFLESARLYLELLLFISLANKKARPDNIFDTTFLCREVLKCLYVAEFLFNNTPATALSVAYLDVVKKDDFFGDYNTARSEIVSYYGGRFFPCDASDMRVARSEATTMLRDSCDVSTQALEKAFPESTLPDFTEESEFSLAPKAVPSCSSFRF